MRQTIALAFIVLALTGCASVPNISGGSVEQQQRDYIAYLLHRIEVLEKRTERNEAAILGVNRRVNGLADLVTEPSANDNFPTTRRGR